jgi:DNA-binding response OmpR family regulator
METARPERDEVLEVGALEIRPDDGLCLAAGRALMLSVREFQVLVALARQTRGIVSRRDLYAQVWGAPLRDGDRSVDVYVHKLRVKLELALPGSRLIQTHVGFGYRLDP